MSHGRRRVFLRSATAAVGLIGLSGCSALDTRSRSETPRLVELTALNLDDEPHAFHVRIEIDGETVYRKSKRVPAGGTDEPRGVEFAGYPTRSRPYVLSAWRDDQPASEAATLDFADFESECLGVEVQFGTYGTDAANPRLAILHTTNCGEE